MKTFEEFLTESAGEYDFIKKLGYKKAGNMSDGTQVFSHPHPMKGEVQINKHGEWLHKPHGSSQHDEGFNGTTGASLKAHIERLQK